MADYIYLLENRLSPAQRHALTAIRDIVRAQGLTLFLVGGAVRDLTSGSPVRDLDIAVQGNALSLSKDLESAGAVIAGSLPAAQRLFLTFPGSVRVEVGSTIAIDYPKPGHPVVRPATILEDLRRRDFTANAMALSLNDGSYGLLMDPLNGVADIENRELRLVSNYGFIEDPIRMIRAVRFSARLGWNLEEKTQARYATGKTEGYIKAVTDVDRGYEAEEIVHEEDPLRVMRRLEAEGWMTVLSPAWTSAKSNMAELEKLRASQTQLQLQGVHPDPAALSFPLLTAKMSAKEVDVLKKIFPRQGFVAQIQSAEAEAKEFAAQLGSKAAALPSAAYRLMHSAPPEAVLAVAYTTRSGTLQARFKSFFTEWPQARAKVPYALMQEMRITPDLPGYTELVEKLFFELMDGNLATVEEMRAYLEPYSPPTPPPPVHLRRSRANKKDAKGKARAKKDAATALAEEGENTEDDDAEEKSSRRLDDDEDADEEPDDLGEVAELPGGHHDPEPPVSAGRNSDEDAEDSEEAEDSPAPRSGKAPVSSKTTPPAIVATVADAPVPEPAPPAAKAPVRKVTPAKPVAAEPPVLPPAAPSAAPKKTSAQPADKPAARAKASVSVGTAAVGKGTVAVKAVAPGKSAPAAPPATKAVGRSEPVAVEVPSLPFRKAPAKSVIAVPPARATKTAAVKPAVASSPAPKGRAAAPPAKAAVKKTR